MASMFYELVGRIFVARFLSRHRREFQLAGAGALLAVVGGAYLLSKREPPEG